MNLRILVPLIAVILFPSCGPDWGDCQTCKPGEESAESVDGNEQIPVSVNVTVIVDQDQSQTQTQVEAAPPAPPPPAVDAGTPGKTCRRECSCLKKAWKCGKNHKHGNSCKSVKKCVKEVVRCS